MADIISNIIDDKQDVKNQLGTVPDVIPSVKRFSSSFQPKRHSAKIYEATVGFGSFVLNSSEYGVLGTDELGRGGHTDTLYAIAPQNNLFEEYYHEPQYIDLTSSTGTLNSDETYSLGAGEILKSEIIAKLRQPVNKVKLISPTNLELTTSIAETNMALGSLSLGITLFDGVVVPGDIVFDVSINDSDWVTITDINTEFSLNGNVNDELKYRISATNAVELTEPIRLLVN